MTDVANEADDPVVRVRIDVAGLSEEWEMPARESTLLSALAAVETVAAELRLRYERAQELERQFGGESL